MGDVRGDLLGPSKIFKCFIKKVDHMLNKYPKGSDRSPEIQQVQSLDKVIGVFTIYGGHLGHVTLKPYLHQQNSSCL